MTSVDKTAIPGRLLAALSMMAAGLSGSAQAQTTPWNTNGSGIWYSPSGVNVGIGTPVPGGDVGMTGGLTINGTGGTQFTVQQNGTSSFALNAGFAGAGSWVLFDKVGGTWNQGITQSRGNVGIGITNPTSRLAVNGNIAATEVLVTATPSDYVFDPAYRLAPLSEVANYIRENHHLPGIPSGADVLNIAS